MILKIDNSEFKKLAGTSPFNILFLSTIYLEFLKFVL